MPNHDTVLRRVEVIATNKRQLVTERGQVQARMSNMAPGIRKVFLAQRLEAIKEHLTQK